MVSYANSVKTDILHVDEQTLKMHGAVSEETVIKMVKGAVKELKADYCIATSGIMGPDGGTAEKPIGTVWVGVGTSERVVTHLFNFRFDRARNIEMAAVQALNLFRRFLLGEA